MGWRFRKRVSLGPFFRINLSGSGVSLGIGPRGANINISKRGVRQTVGLPGTGLYHTTEHRWASVDSANKAQVPPPADPGTVPVPSEGSRWSPVLWAFVLFSGLGLILAFADVGGSKMPTPPSAAVVVPPPPPVEQAPRSLTPAQLAAPTPFPPPAPAPAPAAPPSRPLTVDEVKEAQTILNLLGYESGAPDGIVGPQTIGAVKRLQAARAKVQTGIIDLRLLEDLRDTRRALSSPQAIPAPASPSVSTSRPTTDPASEEMRRALRVIRDAEHPCPVVLAAQRVSDGSLRASCSNGEVYRIFQVRGDWVAMKCSAAQRMGVQGC